MKVKLHIKADVDKKDLGVISKFLKFANSELKLNDDIKIEFVDEKTKDMTTGVREKNHHIKVLCKHRMLIDILRTVGHEWVHEFQHQKMGVKDTDKLQKIGGWGENMANAVSGILIKKFIKNHKELEDVVY